VRPFFLPHITGIGLFATPLLAKDRRELLRKVAPTDAVIGIRVNPTKWLCG
jgi:hypothetical protein